MRNNRILLLIICILVIVVSVGFGIFLGIGVVSKEQLSENTSTIQKDNPDNEDTSTPANNDKDISAQEKESIEFKNDTNIVKGESVNNIYKSDTSKAILDEVKDKYYSKMNNISTYFGRHFIKTGELIFSDEKSENENYTKEFYDMTDNMLNELWNGLKIILSDSEMKKLTQEQIQWIKEKDSINKDGNEILTAKANTLYARGKETYKRCLYLSEKYLNY